MSVGYAPCHLLELMGIHCHPDHEPNSHVVHQLLEDDLVRLPISTFKLELTPKGRAFLEMVLNTPLPVEKWINPQTNKVIDF